MTAPPSSGRPAGVPRAPFVTECGSAVRPGEPGGRAHYPVRVRRPILDVLAERVLIADGAMGTMLQAADLTLDDFEGHEGCNEVLNVSRPDVVRAVHEAYFAAGADCVETNTFGTNLSALREYGIEERIFELAQAGARLAREAADAVATADRPRFVLGAIGPGTKLPTLGHIGFARAARRVRAERGRADRRRRRRADHRDRQDLLQVKAAVTGSRRAMADAGRTVPIICHVTVETTGTMLLGSEIGAALTALEPLGIDLIGLNCATGPAEMSEHLRYLVPARPDPAVGDAERRPAAADRRRRGLPADPRRAGRGAGAVRRRVRGGPGRRLLRHHAGAHPGGGPQRLHGARPGPVSRAASRACRRSTTTCRSPRTPAC